MATFALFALTVAACGPETTQAEAIETARSHVEGEAQILNVQGGRWADLAPAGAQVTDPDRLVWAITLRGVFAIDCAHDATGAVISCPDPYQGLIILQQDDGTALSFSRIVPN